METYEVQGEAAGEVHGYTPDEMSTGERTGAAKLKWVVIVDRSLSPGQAVNAAVCVSAATAPAVSGLLGPDAAEQWHPGLPWAGCSILAASAAELAAIRQQAIDRKLLVADMPAAAQATRVYDDYLRALAKTHPDDLALLAVSLIGPRNQVAKLVRRLERAAPDPAQAAAPAGTRPARGPLEPVLEA